MMATNDSVVLIFSATDDLVRVWSQSNRTSVSIVSTKTLHSLTAIMKGPGPFCSSALVFAGSAIFCVPTCKGVPEAYFESEFLTPFQKKTEPWNTLKKWFLSRKRQKDGERVARGHPHDRVGESPLQYKNFGAAELKNLFRF